MKKQQGWTLTEMVVAVFVIGTTCLGVYMLWLIILALRKYIGE